MTVISKIKCNGCTAEQPLTSNHVWTIRAAPDGSELLILRGLAGLNKESGTHLCSADCLAKAVARWAAGEKMVEGLPADRQAGLQCEREKP